MRELESMIGSPSVSIITPTKNRLNLLKEAMDSVRNQSSEDWEHVIIDDGSNDGTSEEVSSRMAADPRIRYVRRTGEKSGASVCRNIGVEASRSEFIVFLDSDDLLSPDCLARRVDIMRRNCDIDFATFQTAVFQHTPGDLKRAWDEELLGDDLLRFLFFECPWIITGPIWRRNSLLRLGLFDEALLSWQDIDLHVRALTAGLRYLRFPGVDHHVRWQFEPAKVSIEQRRSPQHLEAANEIVEKFERLVREGPGMNWVRQRALCSLYFFIAQHLVAAGTPTAALRSWSRIRRRRLGSRVLHLSGAAVLILQTLDVHGRSVDGRLANKWKGWMRLRTNPELVAR
jgi:glycosyltransferase involved in cell wall biosynthesis